MARRYLIAFLLAFSIVTFLFALLITLIKTSEVPVNRSGALNLVNFIREKKDPNLRLEDLKPEPPPKPAEPPPPDPKLRRPRGVHDEHSPPQRCVPAPYLYGTASATLVRGPSPAAPLLPNMVRGPSLAAPASACHSEACTARPKAAVGSNWR